MKNQKGEQEIGIIITLRVESNRIREKALREINGVKTIEILLNHLRNNKYQTIIAVPDGGIHPEIKEIADRKGIEIFEGSYCPTQRLYECAKEYSFDHIVRITVDDILIDLTLLFLQIKFHIGGNRDYTYMKRCPEGVAGEVFSYRAIEHIVQQIDPEVVEEFASYYAKNDMLNWAEYYPPFEYQHSFRLTMDHEEDLTLLRVLFSLLKNPGTLDLINLLKQNKYLLRINALPKVSIITTLFNVAPFIEECISSVLEQDFQDYEYLIIDDGSGDGGMNKVLDFLTKQSEIVREKVKVYSFAENTGQTEMNNFALEKAKGKYIMHVDGDDILFPGTLKELVGVMEQDTAAMATSGYCRIDKDGNPVGEEHPKNDKHLGCSLIRKWLLNELRYRDNFGFQSGRNIFEKIRENGSIIYYKEIGWAYRDRCGQLTKDANHPESQ